jgi:DNA polymerase-3 subunit epsilon
MKPGAEVEVAHSPSNRAAPSSTTSPGRDATVISFVTFRESLLVDPGVPVPDEARAIHGITDEELSGAPKIDEVLSRVVERLRGRLPVAYNADFDRGFLHAEVARVVARIGELTDAPAALRGDVVWIDPLVWAREILRDLKSRRLGDVCAHFGIPLEQAHRAAGDAEATGRVLLALAERMPTMYGEVVRLQSRYAAFQEAELAAWKATRA